ncbi:putative glycolipid-binding domain-containing protein [Corynebacterium sp. p3-SID1194]|uniref:putative glycolipid-binding domain-containing protein n=1 Tax=Corynebacterium sp. p3-SID1194 TaxID=2916105 RepID=UPI0021A56D5E|nr:putative glycolipid-binding domain-containing protein [Corynebacterium sp. p3-SID1194]MCT1450091.1 putative glycolipid-binding domain-containing protein [Corynebacterium sp. p3-SID1194]
MERIYKWEHVDNPLIRNDAAIQFFGSGLTATGMQFGEGYEARWELQATENWVTQSVSVTVEGDGWERSLNLVRSEQGIWSSETNEKGTQPSDLPSPGIAQSADLSAALDCDLGLCPLTNTMPIRRLGLLETQVPKTQLIMAWIDMPSLQVIASDQYYSSIDSKTVRYASGTRGVDVELEVDGDGVVVQYPDMAQRI